MEERGYIVVRPLGHGGQGRVYEVQDRSGSLCVLKQMPWVGEGDRERAIQEVRLLSSLRHPCIVPYWESFLARSMPSIPTEDVLCLVMSRCEHDLRHECELARDRGERFEEARAVLWLTQLCWGLQHLHARKFLHRDLKPQNVLLTASRRAQLADFGVAGRLEHSQDFRRSIVGTPSFMSPEMLEGRPYGFKTDQWALGCVLYEIMALKAPFANCEGYAAIVAAVLTSEPLRAPDGYSPALSSVLEELLARKPDSRPSNADLLGRPLLREDFRELLQQAADEVRESAAASPAESGPEEEYASDFESYSGSEEQECIKPSQSGSMGVGSWQQIYIEAEALLEPMPPLSPIDEVRKIRDVLRTNLGSDERVQEALEFLRERRPLWGDGDVLEEEILQIELVEQFGDAGLHALPLLERCMALESH
eukprot:TRINITY_DN9249_c0_g1_i1.p1 TRINITY_DN9249_c0_g1~~TRINITY_DN9249_c0_g1_i1.p1  ORF type:complete len:461 (+),score=77.22 TRINITY_DN9249_c0_g1_i1:119-1384(+)